MSLFWQEGNLSPSLSFTCIPPLFFPIARSNTCAYKHPLALDSKQRAETRRLFRGFPLCSKRKVQRFAQTFHRVLYTPPRRRPFLSHASKGCRLLHSLPHPQHLQHIHAPRASLRCLRATYACASWAHEILLTIDLRLLGNFLQQPMQTPDNRRGANT